MDLAVTGGKVVDGTSGPPFAADVGIEGGKIVAIGDLSHAPRSHTLEATGLVVAPGFIDIHSHSDFTLLVDPRAQSSIAQGVTTEVVGNCGHGCAPIGDPDLFTSNIYGYTQDVDLDWHTMAEYLERLSAAQPAVNVVPLVPNGNLRLAVLGLADRPAAPDEVEQMGWLLQEGLEAGAFGFANGLEYPAERACSEEETLALCRSVARANGLYATHTRNREVHAIEAIEEALRVAERARVRLQVSHIIPRRGGPEDAYRQAVAVVERARARGVDVAFDAHTRLHGITNLSNALPSWALDGGPARLRARLRSPTARAAMKRDQNLISSFGLGGWDRVFLFRSECCPDRVGESFQDLAPPGGDAHDAIFDVLLAEADDPHAPLCICHSYEEDELRFTFQHALCMIGSDATALCSDGPLADSTFLGAYTWAAWFFRRMVKELGAVTLEEGIYKLTAQPADRLRLSDRGRLQEGARADIVAFDPARFREHGTLAEPNRLASGMVHVVVDGGVTLEDGKFTGSRGGQVLRRR